MASILLVDDQPDLRNLIALALENEGHEVREASDAAGAFAGLDGNRAVDLLLLDIELAGESGLDVMSSIHRARDIPVILVSARAHEADRIVGLRLGAEDYVVKPFSMGELMARISTVLRRCSRPQATVENEDAAVVVGSLCLRRRRREVSVRGALVHLTHMEFALLDHFVRSPGQVFSRDELLQDVWRSRAGWQDPATVTEHIRRLRHKLEVEPNRPRLIQTVRGTGYRLVPEVDGAR